MYRYCLNTLPGWINYFILITSLVALSNTSQAEEFGNRIFEFQHRLAERGNTFAEYKLGTLYEFGISVDADTDKAITWYRKAAGKQYLPAINRLTYHEIRKNGFRKQTHSPWLKELVKQAQSSEPNAMIVLGQMYHHGIHLKQDLNKALYFLDYASALGHTEIDQEIAQIQNALEPDEEIVEKTEKTSPQSTKSVSKTTSKPKKVVARKKESEADKRKKYEEAMLLLQEEARLLEEQQDWAESN